MTLIYTTSFIIIFLIFKCIYKTEFYNFIPFNNIFIYISIKNYNYNYTYKYTSIITICNYISFFSSRFTSNHLQITILNKLFLIMLIVIILRPYYYFNSSIVNPPA